MKSLLDSVIGGVKACVDGIKAMFGAGAATAGLALLGLCGAIAPADAQIYDTRFFAAPTRLYGATNAYCIVPAVGDRVAVVRTLEVLTDLSGARVGVFTNGPQVSIPYDVTSSNIQVSASGTNGLAAGDNILLHIGNTPNDRYERVRLVTVSTTNLLYTPTITGTITAGSYLYRVSTNTWFYGVTNGATSLRDSFVAVGQRGQPMLIDVNLSAAGSLNAVGEFRAEK